MKKRMCAECDKGAYDSELDVIHVLLRRSFRSGGLALRYYECPHGNGWHMTKRVNSVFGPMRQP